jgi:hypothetical protein
MSPADHSAPRADVQGFDERRLLLTLSYRPGRSASIRRERQPPPDGGGVGPVRRDTARQIRMRPYRSVPGHLALGGVR